MKKFSEIELDELSELWDNILEAYTDMPADPEMWNEENYKKVIKNIKNINIILEKD